MEAGRNALAFVVSLGILALFALYVFLRCLCRPGAQFKLRRWHSDGVVVFKDDKNNSYRLHDCKSLALYLYQWFMWKDSTCYNIPDAQVTVGGKNRSQNELCAICLKAFSLADKVLTLQCKHGFHGNCIMPWLTASSGHTCPLCARSIKLTEVWGRVNTTNEELGSDNDAL